MTYCVGLMLEAGLVFASDTRTNAGVDYISSYSKMHIFNPTSDRLFVLLTAGNLATAQAVMSRIRRDIENSQSARGGPVEDIVGPDLLSAKYMFEAVDYVGKLSVFVQKQHSNTMRQLGGSGEASFILGGADCRPASWSVHDLSSGQRDHGYHRYSLPSDRRE